MMVESGHNGFDTEAEDTGFDYLVEEKKKTLLDSGYQGDVVQEAVHLSLPIFEKRHEMNKNFWESELQRETETVTTYEIRYNRQRDQLEMYHPEYETFLQDMLLRTERYAKEKNQPQVFNKGEMDAIIQAERALVEGETKTILYPVWHESGKVRYVTEMTIEEGVVKNRYVDVGKIAGKDLSQQEAISLFQAIRVHHGIEEKQSQTEKGYPMLYLKEDEVGFREIALTTYDRFSDNKIVGQRDVIIRPMGFSDHQEYENRMVLQDSQVEDHEFLGAIQIAEQLYKEKFVPYIQHHVERKSENPKNNKERKKERKTIFQSDILELKPITHENVTFLNAVKNLIFVRKTDKGADRTLGIGITTTDASNDSSKNENDSIRKSYEKDTTQVIVSKDMVGRKSKKERVKKVNGDVSLKGIKPKENVSFYLKRGEISGDAKSEKKTKTKKRSRLERSSFPLFEKRRLFRKSRNAMKEYMVLHGMKENLPKESRKKEKLKNRILKRKDIKIFYFFEKMKRRMQKEKVWIQKYSEKIHTMREKKKQSKHIFIKEKINIETFDFIHKVKEKFDKRLLGLSFIQSWLVFLIISNSLESISPERMSEKKDAIQRKKVEEPSSSCVWVLLSIIWYMTMIREQGMSQTKVKKKKKKKKNTINRHAIIYAYQS